MQAHQIAKEALRADSSNSQSLSLIGTIEVSLKQFRAAQEHFRAGHELCPEDAKILGAWARMEAQCGNIQHARQLFQQAYDLGESNVILLQVSRQSLQSLHGRNVIKTHLSRE